MVGKLQCDSLTNQLLDYFMDEKNEATMKGPQYVFYLHIVLKNFEEATKVASLIATQEQVNLVKLELFFKLMRATMLIPSHQTTTRIRYLPQA